MRGRGRPVERPTAKGKALARPACSARAAGLVEGVAGARMRGGAESASGKCAVRQLLERGRHKRETRTPEEKEGRSMTPETTHTQTTHPLPAADAAEAARKTRCAKALAAQSAASREERRRVHAARVEAGKRGSAKRWGTDRDKTRSVRLFAGDMARLAAFGCKTYADAFHALLERWESAKAANAGAGTQPAPAAPDAARPAMVLTVPRRGTLVLNFA